MSISLDFDQIPPARPGTPVAVFRYFPGEASQDGLFEPLSMVRCLNITRMEGAQFSTAEFEYVVQNAIQEESIIYFENVLPLIQSADSGDVVKVDDRLVVAGLTPDGDYRFLFDGFCTSPGSRWAGDRYEVGFHAVGVEKRCWDDPLLVRWERHCDKASDGTANVACRREVRFNPKGRPNRTPDNADMLPEVSDEELSEVGLDPDDQSQDNMTEIAKYINKQSYPIFMDERFHGKASDGSDAPQFWTMSDFGKYVLSVGNQEKYVKNPDMKELDALLDVYTPKQGQRYINIKNPSTYDENPIVIRDVDVTGMTWPEALGQVLGLNGFSMTFRLTRDADGFPETILDIYKSQDNDPSKYKDLYLDEWYARFDPAANNVSDAEMQHDTSAIVNRSILRTDVVHKEISWILNPLFKIEAEDVANKGNFIQNAGSLLTGPNAKKYRDYGVDECGEGHWDMATWSWSTDAPDLSAVFPPAKGAEDEPDVPTYVNRPRPAKSNLNSRRKDGASLRAMLHISLDYGGPTGAPWDGTSGTWFPVASGHQWGLLRDRLGVHLTCKDPNAWSIGKLTGSGFGLLTPGVVRSVEWMKQKAAYSSTSPNQPCNFYLMLTCVVEEDSAPNIASERRSVSPTEFETTTYVDARNEFKPKYIYTDSWTLHNLDESEYNVGQPIDDADPESDNYIDYDDKSAKAYADSKREAGQLGKFQIRTTIPRLTNSYNIGDRIRSIDGRDCSLIMNLTGGVETASYPKVVGVVWKLGDGEATNLILSDMEIVRHRMAWGRRRIRG